jgi:hypothetical protein
LAYNLVTAFVIVYRVETPVNAAHGNGPVAESWQSRYWRCN